MPIAEQKKYLTTPNSHYPHLHIKSGDISPAILLAGDPGRVELMKDYLEQSKLLTDKRGLPVYLGYYRGIPVTLACTGMGSPSAAIVLEELTQTGGRHFIRIGSCAAIQADINIGDIIVATGAVRDEGTSSYYVPISYPAIGDPELQEHLWQMAQKNSRRCWRGLIRTTDSFYEGERKEDIISLFATRQVLAFEMETSCLFVLGSVLKVQAGCLLVPGANLVTGTSTYCGQAQAAFAKGIEIAIKIGLETLSSL